MDRNMNFSYIDDSLRILRTTAI